VADEQARPDIAAARENWNALKQALDVGHLVFVDETWTKTNMARTRGRAPRGKRLVSVIPDGHWKTSTFVAGLRHDRMVAPLMLDGAINGDAFLACVEQFLAPTLAPGDIVIADNLASHKVAGVRQAIEARHASLRFLPAYSPDLNPIELRFSKIKAQLRKAEPRSREALWQTTGRIVQDFTRAECANFLANAGYGQSG
jgi:transposase